MKKGIYVGRFQPFHLGHWSVVERACKMVDELTIVIGSAQHSFTWYNPFTVEERVRMIKESIDDGLNVRIMSTPDIEDPSSWPEYIMFNAGEDIRTLFSGNMDGVVSLFQKHCTNMDIIIFGREKLISASDVRKMMGKGDAFWKTQLPEGTIKVIEECNGEQRIKNLFDKRDEMLKTQLGDM